MKIKLLIEGGDMKPGPAVAQQLGPMGVNMGKVISEVNEATKEFKGMKVPVELDIDEKTKEFTVHTSSPPTSELLKKELNLEKGSGKISETKVGNLAIEDIIKVAKVKLPNMLERDLRAAVKSVLGTCASIGILVENENANDLIQKIETGKFEQEISEGKTEVTTEKREILRRQFENIKSAQEAKAAEEAEASKEAEEESSESSKENETKPPEGEAKSEEKSE
jgi:large subunit ribosomal protein L11